MKSKDPQRHRDLFDVLDDLGVDLDDPQYAGMDAFDVAEELGISGDEPDGGTQ
jgi:hypothetical protein